MQNNISICKLDIDPAFSVPPNIVGNCNSAWLCQRFKTRGNVDAITKYVVLVDDNVVKTDANAKPDRAARIHQRSLNCHGRFDRRNY